MSRPAGVLLLLVRSGVCPSQVLLQTYLSLGGGSVTGTCTVPGQEWSFGPLYIVLLLLM